MIELVISRHQEKIDWLHGLEFPYKIYNKGDDLPEFCVKLKNIGREAHTILFHICNNFYKLKEYTFFLQGNPFDHWPGILESFQKMKNGIIDGIFLNGGCFGYGKKHEEDFIAYPDIMYAYKLYESLYGSKIEKFVFTAGAQVMVHRDHIKQHSLNFYRYCLLKMEHFEEKSGFDAWSFERIWPIIFDNKHQNKNNIDSLRLM